jgi:uncharacterized membrane protein (UPF0182 family)
MTIPILPSQLTSYVIRGLLTAGLFYALTLARYYSLRLMEITKVYKFMIPKNLHSISTLFYLFQLEILKLKVGSSNRSLDLSLLVILAYCVSFLNLSLMQECRINAQKVTMFK